MPVPEGHAILDEVTSTLRDRENELRGWRTETRDVRALARNDWEQVFPKDFNQENVPMIANLPRLAIEDGGRLFAEVIPQERVDPPGERERKAAEIREQALHAYNNESEVYDDTYEMWGQDLIAAGLAAIKVWPNFNKPVSKRLPVFSRIDPELVLPSPNQQPNEPSDDVITQVVMSEKALRRQFSDEKVEELLELNDRERMESMSRGGPVPIIGKENQGKPTTFEVVSFYSSRYVARVALIRSEDGHRTDRGVVLYAEDNPFGMCPVQIAFRKNWSKGIQGAIGDSKGTLQARNRYWKLLLAQFTQMVYGPTMAWNIRNPNAKSGILHALGPDAKYQKAGPDQPAFQVFQILAQLEDETRTGMVRPRSREGEVELNKASAAFLTRAQGELTSVTRSNHRSYATAKRRANEVGFEVDKAWCNAKKQITGRARGKRFAVGYTPKKDIGDDIQNRVVYGLSSGTDRPTHNVIMLQLHGQGLASDERVLESDPDVDDPDAELARIRKNAIGRGLLAKLLNDPAVTFEQMAELWEASKGGADLDGLVERFNEIREQGQPMVEPSEITGEPGGGAPSRPGTAEAEAPEEGLLPLAELQAMAQSAGRR